MLPLPLVSPLVHVYLHVYTSRQPRNEVRQRASFANFGGGQCAVTTDSDGQAGQPPHLKPSLALTLPLLLFFTPGSHARRRTRRLSTRAKCTISHPISIPRSALSVRKEVLVFLFILYILLSQYVHGSPGVRVHSSSYPASRRHVPRSQSRSTATGRGTVIVTVTVTRSEIQYVSNSNACACPVLPVEGAAAL